MTVKELKAALTRANDTDIVLVHVRTFPKSYAVATCEPFAPETSVAAFDLTIELPSHMHTVSRAK